MKNLFKSFSMVGNHSYITSLIKKFKTSSAVKILLGEKFIPKRKNQIEYWNFNKKSEKTLIVSETIINVLKCSYKFPPVVGS